MDAGDGQPFRAIEFFSGIGGMHYALKKACPSSKVVAAFDINAVANDVYKHNFGIAPVTVCVEHLPVGYYEKLRADVWLMSPPCQPFTKGGNMLDHKDHRSAGLLHMIDVLGRCRFLPQYVFLENVPNFEVSECHRLLIEQLERCNYRIREYLVSPCDPAVNVPNNRMRYYLAAERARGPVKHDNRILRSLSEAQGVDAVEPRRLELFLRPPADPTPFLVPLRYLTEYKSYRHDVKSPWSTTSTTFTKAYASRYIIGTGSFLQTKQFDRQFETDDPEALVEIGLRFFTPEEIALLHGFPWGNGFGFPERTAVQNQYRLLGNSLNIDVVALILRTLFNKA